MSDTEPKIIEESFKPEGEEKEIEKNQGLTINSENKNEDQDEKTNTKAEEEEEEEKSNDSKGKRMSFNRHQPKKLSRFNTTASVTNEGSTSEKEHDEAIERREMYSKSDSKSKTMAFSENEEIISHPIFDEKSVPDRKRASFTFIKNWEDKRVLITNIHKSMVENISKKLFKKARESIENLNTIISFFRDRVLQETKYAQMFTSKLSQAYRPHEKELSPAVYETLQKTLSETDDLHKETFKKVDEFAKFMDKDLLRENLLNDQRVYTAKINQYETNFERERKRLSKLTNETSEKYSEYSRNYSETMKLTPEEKKKKSPKDLYTFELTYLGSAIEQFNVQKEYGKQMLKFWEELKKIETERVELIRKVFMLYLDEYEKIFIKPPMIETIKKIFSSLKTEESVGKMFEVSNILSLEENNYIKKLYNIKEINFDELAFYVDQIKLHSIQTTPMVLGSFNGMREAPATKAFTESHSGQGAPPKKMTVETKIIITVDNYLLLIDGYEDWFKRPEKQVKLDISTASKDYNALQIDLREQKPGLIFNSVNHYVIWLESHGEMDRFLALLKTMVKIL